MLIDLRLTMESGQPPQFIWKQEGDKYYRYVEGRKCYLWQEAELHCTPGYEDYVREFLRAKDDLEEIYAKIATDAAMRAAINRYRGLRLTKNDPWETLVSFVCSINNNIPRIRRNVQSLIHRGRMLTPGEILERDLTRYRLGFRADFLRSIAEHMTSYDLGKIGRMSYEEAKATLMELPGVGEKVAECVLLFGYGFLEAFPVDVWVGRAMETYYGVRGRKKIAEYARRKWGPYAGYAQQYLYCSIRGL
jgi:N-glycosylase/DNA lyase